MPFLKRALKAEPGYAIGTPAPMYLDCLCGHSVSIPKPFDQSDRAICATCGREYDGAGWIIYSPPKS